MIDAKVTTEFFAKRILDAADRAAFKNMPHAAATISKDAKASLLTAPGPSVPGTPPHTHRGAFLRRAIRFDYDRKRQEAVIGPMESVVGEAGAAHEFGQFYKGADYPERPFMLPALEANVDRFAASWSGSIGS